MIDAVLRVDVLLFVVVGLLGGAHCIGMCGPLVTMYAGRMGQKEEANSRGRRRGHLTTHEVRQHTLFNLGRAASYTLMGALFGGLGGLLFLSVDRVSTVAGLVRGLVGILIGVIVIAVGARYLLGGTATSVSIPGLGTVTGWVTGIADRFVDGPGIVGLGAIHGLFPCPILYPAYLFAFATGSVVSGALALGSLGLGTIPAVFLYGTLIESVDAVHRRRVHRLLGGAFLVLGYVLLAHGLMAVGIHLPHPELPHYQPFGTGASH